jgi:hypothetical protein
MRGIGASESITEAEQGRTMATVTLDTNILPAADVLAKGRGRRDEFAVVSVTEREIGSHPLQASLRSIDDSIHEIGIWGEGVWGNTIWASEESSKRFEAILAIITDGSFPADRSTLSKGERRQLRDALIFEAHARAGRDIFVTNDQRGFILNGRRAALQVLCSTTILTSAEYLALK